eukprot:2814207-Ditylum_brightwellii.AAC.1
MDLASICFGAWVDQDLSGLPAGTAWNWSKMVIDQIMQTKHLEVVATTNYNKMNSLLQQGSCAYNLLN